MIFLSDVELVRINFDGQETQSMDKKLIRYDRRILIEVDFVKSHGGYFCNDDPSESIGERRINANELQFKQLLSISNDWDINIVL